MKNMEQVMEERGRILDAREVLQKASEDVAAESGPTDKSQLKKLIEGLRAPFATTNASLAN